MKITRQIFNFNINQNKKTRFISDSTKSDLKGILLKINSDNWYYKDKQKYFSRILKSFTFNNEITFSDNRTSELSKPVFSITGISKIKILPNTDISIHNDSGEIISVKGISIFKPVKSVIKKAEKYIHKAFQEYPSPKRITKDIWTETGSVDSDINAGNKA